MRIISRSPRRRGFTLIELTVVMFILAIAAVMVMPKRFYSFESPIRELQRTAMELSDLALDGIGTRLRLETVDRADVGRVVIEAYIKVENPNDPQKYTLEWRPVDIQHPLTGDRWKLEPEIVYFYPDGTCTPARILYIDPGTRVADADSILLTVTGFLFEEKTDRS